METVQGRALENKLGTIERFERLLMSAENAPKCCFS